MNSTMETVATMETMATTKAATVATTPKKNLEKSATICGTYEKVNLQEDHFGFLMDTMGKSNPVRRFTWRNDNNISVQVITYGATITSIRMPDKNGTTDDIVMGFDDMDGYLNTLNPYFGATVGRVANRIGDSTINIDGTVYRVTANLRQHQLHGGLKGFDKVNWDYHIVDGNKVVMSCMSEDGEEGFPGAVLVNITYELTADDKFRIDYKATTTKPTFVNLTNHSYFNLAGHGKGAEELYKHVVCINADRITDVDSDSIPNGKFIDVANTVFDLQIPKTVSEGIDKIPSVGGYDHNFCVTKATEQGDTFIARVVHPSSGRTLELYSNQPGVQFYTSNGIPVNPNDYKGEPGKLDSLEGKAGVKYYKHGALCLETQNYPDAINHENFPKAVLYPGETYHHTITYKLILNKAM